MVVLLLSDIHLHVWKQFGMFSKGLTRRLQEQINVLDQVVKLCIEKQVKILVFGGDLFHKTGEIPVECLNIAQRFFKQLEEAGVLVLFTDGNHDLVELKDPEWFQSAISLYGGHRPVQSYDTNGMKIRLVNYDEVIDYDKIKDFDLVVLHKQPMNCVVNSHKFPEGVSWAKLANQNGLVAFGHIHERQELSENCIVIGSPMHHTFGDIGERGVYLVTYADGKMTYEFVKLEYPEFRTVEVAEEIKDTKNYYRVLKSLSKIDQDNVISVTIPEYFEERIKSESLRGMLEEWIKIQNKEHSYIKVIEDLLTDKFKISKTFFKGKLETLGIRDFISVGTIDYTFKPGFALITGQSEDFDSNGSGKTSFCDAIYWVLFGETTKGLSGDDVIRRGCKDCLVQVTLVSEFFRYTISRKRSSGLSILRKNLQESSEQPMTSIEGDLVGGLRQPDRQKFLEEQILGFNKSVYLASCYFSQESLAMLTGLSDTAKTDMITGLLGFEVYDDLYEKVTAKRDSAEAEQETIANLLKESTHSVEKLKIKKDSINDKIKKLVEDSTTTKTKAVELHKKKEELSKRIEEEVKAEAASEKNYDETLQELRSMEVTLESNKNKVKSARISKDVEITEVSNAISKIKYSVSNYDSQIAKGVKRITNLQELKFGERCGSCGTKITKETSAEAIVEIQMEIDSLIEQKKTEQSTLVDLDSKYTTLKSEYIVLDGKFDGVDEKVRNVQADIRATITERDGAALRKKEVANRKKKMQEDIDSYSKWIVESDQALVKIMADQEASTKELTGVNAKIEEAAINMELAIKRGEALKTDIESLEFWKQAFSSKGIRSLLLDRFCNQFNVVVNKYLAMVSNGVMNIVVRPTKTLKSGEDRNKVGLDVMMNSEVVKYESLSGGEKRRVDCSLCLALNRWVSSIYGIPDGLLGVLILDELFSFVDRTGEEAIAAVLCDEGYKKAVLVISHTAELGSYASQFINLIKKDGKTRLECTS